MSTEPPNYGAMPPPPQGGVPTYKTDPSSAPSTVLNAVRIMYAIAALGIIGVIIAFADKDSIRKAIRDANNGYSDQKLDDATNAAVVVAVVIAIVIIVLYVLLAMQVRKGKNWARIVTWVLSALGALGAITNLAQPQATLYKVLAVIELIAYVALILLLAMKPSNDYFRRPAYR